MKKLLMSLLPVALVGCHNGQQTAVEFCQGYVKAKLRSPSTFERVSVEVKTFPAVTERDFRDLTREDPIIRTGNLGLKTVEIQYDAANAYGTPIRNIEKCAFRLSQGSIADFGRLSAIFNSPALLQSKAESVEFSRNTADVINSVKRSRGEEPDSIPLYECCLW